MARILFFAQARTLIGQEELVWPLEEPKKAEDLWAWLTEYHPAAAQLRPYCRIACNGEYLLPTQEIMPHDDIAIIPPVSGG
jgi:molybdopterin converting factor small subunit